MYAKILKESASGLSLLMIENDRAGQEAVGKNLSPFFKRIDFVTHQEEASKRYRTEKYDLIQASKTFLNCYCRKPSIKIRIVTYIHMIFSPIIFPIAENHLLK